MRLANLDHRAVLIIGEDIAIDVHKSSDGRFGPELTTVYDQWSEFTTWAQHAPTSDAGPVEPGRLQSPSPQPRQVFAIGLNYRDHAKESGFEAPDRLPPTFTKFPSSITGAVTDVVLPPGGNTDWEVELVAVIGKTAAFVSEADAWGHVAGLTVGQDISERVSQLAGPAPQFGLGKSFAGFAPLGPWLVTPDEFSDPDDLELGCTVDGEVVQQGRTRDLIYSVPRLVSALSQTVTLMPGDVIFTGTPAGVGLGRTPQRFLQTGEELVSWVEGIGELRQTFVASRTGGNS